MGDRRVGVGLLLALVAAACGSTPVTPVPVTPAPVGSPAPAPRTLPPDVVVVQAGTRCTVGVRPIYPDEVGAVACP